MSPPLAHRRGNRAGTVCSCSQEVGVALLHRLLCWKRHVLLPDVVVNSPLARHNVMVHALIFLDPNVQSCVDSHPNTRSSASETVYFFHVDSFCSNIAGVDM